MVWSQSLVQPPSLTLFLLVGPLPLSQFSLETYGSFVHVRDIMDKLALPYIQNTVPLPLNFCFPLLSSAHCHFLTSHKSLGSFSYKARGPLSSRCLLFSWIVNSLKVKAASV